jgi:hypothetical protein
MKNPAEMEKIVEAIRIGVHGNVRISLDWIIEKTGLKPNRVGFLVATGERQGKYIIERRTERLGVAEWRFAMTSNPANFSRWAFRREAEGKIRESLMKIVREACQRRIPVDPSKIKRAIGMPPTTSAQMLTRMAKFGCFEMERFLKNNKTVSYRVRVGILEWSPWNNGEPDALGDAFAGFGNRLLAPETTDHPQLFEDDPRAISTREPVYWPHKIYDRSGMGCGTALCSEA